MAAFCGIIPENVLKGIIEKGLAPQHIINRCQSTFGKTNSLEMFVKVTGNDAQNSHDDPSPRNKILIPNGGELLSQEADPTSNANECYVGLGKSYDFYFNFFQRNSIDDKGMKLVGFVHAGDLYNAFWEGQGFVFGDGDGVIFNGFTDELDVIGHKSGVLNEAIAGVFGTMIKQCGDGTPDTVDQANWLVGVGIWAAGVNGRALRDMKNPGKLLMMIERGKTLSLRTGGIS
ncbi:thermolysin metallopeptidase [Penicillium canescens]|nr:thermolysin metallopeptidase [Penicillium canescens]KAJ6176779.1 thermolysin metallopeptidase [Penicillium canescens]